MLHQLFASAKALCLFFLHTRNSKWKTLLCCRAYYDFRRCIQEANGRGPKIRVSLVNGHQRAEIPWRLQFQMFNIKILFGSELFFQQLIMDQKWMFIPLPALLIIHEFIPHPWRWKRRIGIGQLKTFQSFPWWLSYSQRGTQSQVSSTWQSGLHPQMSQLLRKATRNTSRVAQVQSKFPSKSFNKNAINKSSPKTKLSHCHWARSGFAA